MLSKWVSQKDRDFLFASNLRIGTLLTANPIAVFLIFSFGCSLLLFLPAWILGIHSISVQFAAVQIPASACEGWDHHDKTSVFHNVGIIYKLNWSLAYTIAIPLIFALASTACRSARRSLIMLFEEGTVQVDDGNNESKVDVDVFLAAISSRIQRWDRAVLFTSLLLALVASLGAANVASRKSNLWVYCRVFRSRKLDPWYNECLWDDIDWMHGWTIDGHRGTWEHMLGNFAFYLLSQIVQGFVIFVGCYFVLKFLSLTQSFASIIIEQNTGFHFEPFISDPEKCLGLKPIGRMFSLFLSLSIVFQLWAFGLRLQKILLVQKLTAIAYFQIVAKCFKSLTEKTDDASTTATVHRLVELAGLQNLDAGLVVVIIMMVVPMAVIAWWPIIRLRNYVSAVRQKRLREFRVEEQQARKTQKYDTAKHLAEAMDKLTKASIWPNGFKVGWGSFFFLTALFVSTFFPPLIVPLVSGGIGLKIFNKITSE